MILDTKLVHSAEYFSKSVSVTQKYEQTTKHLSMVKENTTNALN